jgi:tRNA (guanine26-N2/guanine27-N2)-dimethyltransferase
MSQDAIPDNRQLIQEGSAKMLYPKGVVFYNPVQVQNRDLSLVMMQLFAERRVKRVILKSKRKEFMKAAREAAVNCGEKNKQVVDIEAVEQQVRDYDEKTNWKDVYDNYEGKGIRILDALAASGLRSIRYFNEISPSLLHSVTINDLDAAAVDLAKENIEFNNLSHVLLTLDEESKGDKRGLVVVNNDATHLMYTSRRTPGLHQISPILAMQKDQYDVIDLDPYGSAAPFLDAAVQAVTNGGMLAITCTDMAALGGSHADTCYGRYCSMTIPRAGYLQELALRILLSNIAQRAAVYGRSMRPILSVGMHFYVRVFVEIWDDKAAVNNLSLDIGTVYQSTQCPSFHTVSHGQHAQKNQNVIQATRAPRVPCCEETGGPFKTAGPCWLGPMHNIDVVQEAIARLEPLNDVKKKEDLFGYLKQDRELHGLLTVCSEELPDAPLYYVLPKLSHTLGCSTPPIDKFKSALINAGYRVSGYHKEAQAIKTNAPNSVVWDIMRAWCKENPPNPKSKNKQNKTKKQKRNRNGESCEDDILNVEEQDNNEAVDGEKTELSPSEKILAVEPTIAVDFTLTREVKNKTKALRFPMNPEANWGPKKAASGYKRKVDENDEGND